MKEYLAEVGKDEGVPVREVLHSWLFTDPKHIKETLWVLLLEGHFLDGEVLRSRLYMSLERVCLAALGSQAGWQRAILSAEQAFKKGVHGLDGPNPRSCPQVRVSKPQLHERE